MASLEAPLVAMLWLAAVARAHGLKLMPEVYAGLGLGVWGIYLLDRSIDAGRWLHGIPWTARHSFCAALGPALRWVLLPGLATILAWLALFRVPQNLLWLGLLVASLVAAYLVWHVIWRKNAATKSNEMPKALMASMLFAMGVGAGVYAHEYHYPPWAIIAGLGLLTGLFATNLTGITLVESEKSPAHKLPVTDAFRPVLLLTCLGASAVWLPGFEAVKPLRLLAIAVLLGAALMGVIHSLRTRLSGIAYRCLADAALFLSGALLWWLAALS